MADALFSPLYLELFNMIFERLARRVEVVRQNPDEHRNSLKEHFGRFPASYASFFLPGRVEDVFDHQKLLMLAQDALIRPAYEVRHVNLTHDRGVASNVPKYLVTFSSVDKPKLLLQLCTLLSYVGLHIQAAKAFCTIDGYSLDAFWVNGGPYEDIQTLKKAIDDSLKMFKRLWLAQEHEVSDDLLIMDSEPFTYGTYGMWYRGKYMEKDVVLRALKFKDSSEEKDKMFMNELSILRDIQHKNVIEFLGARTDHLDKYLLTEYMAGGSLCLYLKRNALTVTLHQKMRFALGICEGMKYLHEKNLILNNLKLQNLQFDGKNVVKVADFSVAQILNQEGVATKKFGSYKRMAPEVFSGLPYDQKVDVYHFAFVLWELVTGQVPYNGMTPAEIVRCLSQNLRPIIPPYVHPKLSDLIQRCWATIPASRPSFPAILTELQLLLYDFEDQAGLPIGNLLTLG